MNWYLAALKQYATLAGRAGRTEYWFFVLFTILITAGLSIVDGIAGTISASGVGFFSGLYSLAMLVPGIAVTVRRLHDTDHSGWWYLIVFVPMVGWIVLLIFLVRNGQPGTNAYGADPKNAPEPPGWSASQFGFGAGGTSRGDTLAELERLTQLRDKGALTEEEFQAEKAKTLKN